MSSGEREQSGAGVARVSSADAIGFDWGSIQWLVNRDLAGDAEITFGYVEINPGSKNPRHLHPNCDEVLYVLEGELVHSVGEEIVELGPGTALSYRGTRLTTLGTRGRFGIVVPVNPMLKERELAFVLRDSQAAALVSLESLHDDVAASVLPGSGVRVAVTTSELDLLGDTVPPLLADIRRRRPLDTHDLLDLSRRFAGDRFDHVRLDPDDVAFLTYTSGTTGPPKGAMNTHRNVVFNAQVVPRLGGPHAGRRRARSRALVPHHGPDRAPGRGLVGADASRARLPLRPRSTLDLAERHRATFTIGSITAFIALMSCPSAVVAICHR